MPTIRALAEGAPQWSCSVPAQTSIGTTAAVVALPNQKRKCMMFQNTGTTTIKLNFGTTLPTATVYHVALQACGTANDGSGGVYIEDSWVGAVAALSSSAGGTFNMVEFQTGNPDWGQASAEGNQFGTGA